MNPFKQSHGISERYAGEENPTLENKRKLIIAGVAVGVLALLAICVNVFTGGTSRDDLETAAQIAKELEAERQAQPAPPPVSPDQPKSSFGKGHQNPS